MITIQKAVIAWAKMCETDLDRVTNYFVAGEAYHFASYVSVCSSVKDSRNK